MDDFIFKSREEVNKAISRQQALNILKDASRSVGIKDNVGTHALRKHGVTMYGRKDLVLH